MDNKYLDFLGFIQNKSKKLEIENKHKITREFMAKAGEVLKASDPAMSKICEGIFSDLIK